MLIFTFQLSLSFAGEDQMHGRGREEVAVLRAYRQHTVPYGSSHLHLSRALWG